MYMYMYMYIVQDCHYYGLMKYLRVYMTYLGTIVCSGLH